MFLIYILYYILFVTLIFGLVPAKALFYIRPLLVTLLTITYSIPYFITKRLSPKLKRLILKLSLIVINYMFFMALKEYARISVKVSLIMASYISLAIVLVLSGKKLLKVIGCLLISVFACFLLWPGSSIKYKSNTPLQSEVPNHSISSFTYGIDSDIRSYSVDPDLYYSGSKGLSKWYDKQFWNIDKKLPLNGTLFHPAAKGKYPLIMILHGNSLAENRSDQGYNYLLEHLAGRGYVAVSVDQNFLNGNWTTFGKGYPEENDTRGFLLLEHIRLLKRWNNDKESPIYNQIDMNNIGLIGHSRGGEAVSIAAVISESYKKDYKIKAVATLSPTDRQYPVTIELKNVSYMTIHGANDGDIKKFNGINQYNRTEFDNEEFNLKASYYIEGMNHVQFNSDWGNIDSTSLGKMFYNRRSNIEDYDQREITKVLINNYFDITLRKRLELIPLLIKPSHNPTLPDITYTNDFSDSDKVILYNFDNLIKADVSYKNCSISRGNSYSNRLLKVMLNKGSSVRFQNTMTDIPASEISFSLSNNNMSSVSLNVIIKYNDEIIKKNSLKIKPMLMKRVFKTALITNIKNEAHFQYYEIPYKGKWDSIEFYFITEQGSVSIDNIGISTSYRRKE